MRGALTLVASLLREQSHQCVEELRLANRLGEIRGEQCLAVADFTPAERAEQARSAAWHDAPESGAQARRRPSPACACRRWRRRSPRLDRASALPRRGDSVVATPCPTSPSARRACAVGGIVVDDRARACRCSAGCMPTKFALARAAGSSPIGAMTLKKKVDPLPSPSLSAHMCPPISSARRLLIASPSPVPPYLRVVDESACVNDWKRRLIPSGDRPMPVSRTAKVSSAFLSATGLRGDREHHLALLGELHRVAQEIQHDLAQARHVADDRLRHVALEHVGHVEVLFHGARAHQVQGGLDALAQDRAAAPRCPCGPPRSSRSRGCR